MSNRHPSPWSGIWYFLITILSMGLLSWVPFVHAAGRLRRRSIVVMAVVYAAGAVTAVVLMSVSPADTQEGGALVLLADLLLLSMIVVGCVQQAWLRRQVYRATDTTTDPALAAVRQARARRAEARTLAIEDPLIARDLRIGRPDLPHDYDDGGLVDLNSAPATAIAAVCGLAPTTADSIVTARTRCGGFLTVDDVFSLADVPVGAWDTLRDRGITIPRSG